MMISQEFLSYLPTRKLCLLKPLCITQQCSQSFMNIQCPVWPGLHNKGKQSEGRDVSEDKSKGRNILRMEKKREWEALCFVIDDDP